MSDDMLPEERKNFYERFEVRVALAVVASRSLHAKFLVGLLDDNSITLPSIPLRRGRTAHEAAKLLFTNLTGFESGPWALVKQVGFLEGKTDDSPKTILYSSMIPESVPLKDDRTAWIDVDELLSRTGEAATLISIAMNMNQ
jgi:hypothetical protein